MTGSPRADLTDQLQELRSQLNTARMASYDPAVADAQRLAALQTAVAAATGHLDHLLYNQDSALRRLTDSAS